MKKALGRVLSQDFELQTVMFFQQRGGWVEILAINFLQEHAETSEASAVKCKTV